LRTTITLDEDVARRLKEKARRSGTSFKAVLNETLRMGLSHESSLPRKPFVWRETSLEIGPFESTSELIERFEGPFHK